MTMKFVIALIALFAVSSMAQVTYDVVSIYANDNCTALAAQYVTFNSGAQSTCTNVTDCTQWGAASGHFYMTTCAEPTIPVFSPSWVVASQWDAGCANPAGWLAAMPDTCVIFTVNPVSTGSFLAANLASCVNNASSIVNVGATDGSTAVSSTTCTSTPFLSDFNNTYTCAAAGNTGFAFAISQCQAVQNPIAQPMATPTAPTAQPTAPTTAPATSTPKATPKAGSAVALTAGGILSVVALLLI